MAYSHVAHDCIIGSEVILANSVAVAGHCEVGDWAIIGGMVGLHQFIRVGKLAMMEPARWFHSIFLLLPWHRETARNCMG